MLVCTKSSLVLFNEVLWYYVKMHKGTTDQLMSKMLVCFRNHSSGEHIIPLCRGALSYRHYC